MQIITKRASQRGGGAGVAPRPHMIPMHQIQATGITCHNGIVLGLKQQTWFSLLYRVVGVGTIMVMFLFSSKQRIRVCWISCWSCWIYVLLATTSAPITYARVHYPDPYAPSMFPSLSSADSDLCSCQPQEYQISLDFSSGCDDSTVDDNAGVATFACRTESDGDVLVPSWIRRVQVLELDTMQQVQSQIVFDEFAVWYLEDGDHLGFYSSSSNEDVVSGLQVVIDAETMDGMPIIHSFLIQFTNSCEDYPILKDGDVAGWVRFVRLCVHSVLHLEIRVLDQRQPLAMS